MAIIDPKGLFLGERLAHCSDTAQLHWPRLYAAANGYARLELNHKKIVASAYSSFKNAPSEANLFGWIREYRDEYLLFVYQSNGALWGQWQTNERYLPGYKSADDKRSPAPPVEKQEMYRKRYEALKKQRVLKNQQFADLFEVAPSCEELLEVIAIGVGVGEGDGEGKERKPIAPGDEETIAPEPHIILGFPCLQSEYGLSVTLFEAFQTAYPGIDVMIELQRARVWLLANPTRQKTPKGMSRFLNTWLAREQNSGRITNGGSNAASGRNSVNKAQARTDSNLEALRSVRQRRSGGMPGDLRGDAADDAQRGDDHDLRANSCAV